MGDPYTVDIGALRQALDGLGISVDLNTIVSVDIDFLRNAVTVTRHRFEPSEPPDSALVPVAVREPSGGYSRVAKTVTEIGIDQ